MTEGPAGDTSPLEPDAIVRASLRPMAVALAGLYALFAAAHLVVLPPEIAPVLFVAAVGTALVMAAVALGLPHVALPARLAHPVGAAMAALVLANSLLHMVLTQEARQTTNLLLLVLGMGILFLDLGWFSLVVAATFVGWFLVAWNAPPSPEWVHFGFALVGATVLAAVVLALRARTFRRIADFHARDRMRQLELESSLARTEAARRGEEEARRALEGAVGRLRESEERFRRLAEATFEGVIVHRAGRIVDANETAAELFGSTLSEMLRSDVLDLIAPESREGLAGLVADADEAAGEGARWGPLEAVGIRRDGSRFPLEVSATPARHRGEPVTVTVVRDIGEQKRIQEVFLQAAREAEASNQAKSAFLANMSHELRTPLNSVIGFGNILGRNRAGTLSEKDLEYVGRIVSNGEHLLALIDDILDLSKIEAGRMEVVVEEVALAELVEEVVRSFDLQARRKLVELRAEVPAGGATVPADAHRLRQVLVNLVGNALKFTPSGSVVVRIVVEEDGRPRRVEVEDTGIGIPPDRLSQIFHPFQQVDGSTARRFGGSGLGLAISRSLCRLMGLDLTVRSDVGEGSVFAVELAGPRSRVARDSP